MIVQELWKVIMWFLNTSICSSFQQKAVGTVSMLFYKHGSMHEDFTTKGIQCPSTAGVFSIKEKRTVSPSPPNAELFLLAHFWSPFWSICAWYHVYMYYCSPHCNALLFFQMLLHFFSPSYIFHFSFPFVMHLLSLLFFTSNLIPPVNLCVSADHLKGAMWDYL